MFEDDPAAVAWSIPQAPIELKRKSLFEATFELVDVDPELVDLLMFGQSPGPQFPLGEN